MIVDFDEDSQKALNSLESSSENIFLTGNAGTGKSTLLDHFRNQTGQNVAVVAPTGVAALNVKGETIHSFFGFPPNVTPEKASLEAKHSKKAKIYTNLDVLVIDEISMVRADLLDSIDSFLRVVRKNREVFGGVRIIMVGDLHQLPPVVTSRKGQLWKISMKLRISFHPKFSVGFLRVYIHNSNLSSFKPSIVNLKKDLSIFSIESETIKPPRKICKQ